MTPLEIFNQFQKFIGFEADDVAELRALAPVFAAHGPAITDRFYDRLLGDPAMSAMVAGRVDALKRTHLRWLAELFAGEYGPDYFENRRRIGLAHVRVGVQAWWVEGVTCFLHNEGTALIAAEVEPERRVRASQSLSKILDLDLMVINLAYAEERIDRLSQFTGMSRKLIERCVHQGRG
jgi:hypothetical protein